MHIIIINFALVLTYTSASTLYECDWVEDKPLALCKLLCLWLYNTFVIILTRNRRPGPSRRDGTQVYSAESFPTVVRSAAIGFALSTSRIFAALTLPVQGALLQVVLTLSLLLLLFFAMSTK